MKVLVGKAGVHFSTIHARRAFGTTLDSLVSRRLVHSQKIYIDQ